MFLLYFSIFVIFLSVFLLIIGLFNFYAEIAVRKKVKVIIKDRDSSQENLLKSMSILG